MKTYQITLVDFTTKKTDPVEKITTENLDDIEKRLLELQERFCNKEKPYIKVQTISSKGMDIKTFVAYSGNSDMHYLCPIYTINKI